MQFILCMICKELTTPKVVRTSNMTMTVNINFKESRMPSLRSVTKSK